MIKVADFEISSVRHVLQAHEIAPLLERIARQNGPIILDLETTGLNEHWVAARVVTMALTLPELNDDGDELSYPETYIIGLSHPDAPLHTDWRIHLKVITRAIFKSGMPIIGQNIRFDVRWLTAHTGIDLTPLIIADTGMGSHLLDENQTASLKPRCMAEFGIESWIDFDWSVLEAEGRAEAKRRGILYEQLEKLLAERVDYFTMAIYNARDTYWTWRLHQLHEQEMGLLEGWRDELLADGGREAIEALRLGDYYQKVSVPAIKTLTALEQQGLKIDREWITNRLTELAVITTEQRQVMLDLLHEAEVWNGLTDDQEQALNTNAESFQPTALWFKAWAEVMCDYGYLRVLSLTPEGVPSWTKSVLKRLDRMGMPAATALGAWRKADKESQFLRSWLELVDKNDRLHASYNYYKVVTGRLSSENPNAQQIPRGAKNAFIASPGFLLVTADYSQIEMRVAAHIAQCEPMIEAFNDDQDLHRLMAATIAGVSPELVDAVMRQQAKAANFGFLFGMGASKFVTYAADSYDVDFTEEEAEQFREAFFTTWVGMQEWHNKQRKLARDYGYVKSPLGRMRRLPDVHSRSEFYRSRAERQAINSPVQGMASDMTLIATSKIRRNFGIVRPVALIHDAILCEVPEGQAQQLAWDIKNTMEGIHLDLARLGCDFKVPLKADVAVGSSWGNCVEI